MCSLSKTNCEELQNRKLRGGLFKIGCNEGRYSNTPFHERICILFNQDVETEYHFLLVCQTLSHIRSNHISSIWFTYPSVNNFVQLCTSKSTNIINAISRYVFSAMKFRSQYIKDMNLWPCHFLNVFYFCNVCNFGLVDYVIKQKPKK